MNILRRNTRTCVFRSRRLIPAAGILAAVLATAVSGRAWRGERLLAGGQAAQRRGEFDAATAAYRAASGCGNGAAAVELARLHILRRDWAGAVGSLREAMALTPTRGMPHVLRAELDMNIPGPWTDVRDERILSACRVAAALEPHRAGTRSEAAIIVHNLAVRRRLNWDVARTRAVLAEAYDGFGVVLSQPGSRAGGDKSVARNIFRQVLAAGGDPVSLIENAFRHCDKHALADLVLFLTKWRSWAGAEPDALSARKRFASLLASRELYVEAEREIRAVVRQETNDTAAWFQLGEILRGSGRVVEAAAAYRAAGRQP